MRLRVQLLTKNDCYKSGKTITPKGVMVHSTGANNPKISRYVPGDTEIGKNTGGNHWNQSGKLCVHAFIGKFADGKVGTVQTLPWNRRAWHCGSGKKGSANSTHISFEICEDGLSDKTYFNAIYKEAVELTAMLCKEYKLDPLKDGVVICHKEGAQREIASNHSDVLHWFPRHGKTMDNFRSDVAVAMKGEDEMTEVEIRKIIQDELVKMKVEKLTFEEFETYMTKYREKLQTLPVSSWAQDELEKAKLAGITDATRPRDLSTREEVASMILRAISE